MRLTFEDYDFNPEPEQIKQIYDSGFRGVVPDRLEYAYMRGAAPRFTLEGNRGSLYLPYKAILSLDSGFGSTENQTTGDCVSHSTRNAGSIDYGVDALFGETSFEGRLATENIYGYRGHGGQGADCARLARYTSQDGPGGFLPRKAYSDGANSVDLSNYNSSIGHNWGRPGTPDWLNKIASENKALRVFSLKSVEEAVHALSLGFGITMCSGYGFSSTRNQDGLCEQRGSWAHAMAWVGVDDTDYAHQNYGGPLFLVQNSWGKWNSGPRKHDQPEGSFFIRPQVAENMIRRGGGWVVASVRGYNRELVYSMADKIAELSVAA